MNINTKSGIAMIVGIVLAILGVGLLAFGGRSNTELGIVLILLGVVVAAAAKAVQALRVSRR